MEICDGLIIRKSIQQDCPQILALLKEMSAFLKFPDDQKIHMSVLEKNGFDGEEPPCHCVVAEDPKLKSVEGRGKLVGCGIYVYYYGPFTGKRLYLEDIFVTETYRSRKVGSALFDSVNKIAVDTGCTRVDWSVLDWNSAAKEFYHHKGAINYTKLEGSLHFRLPKEAMLALYQKTTTSHGAPSKN